MTHQFSKILAALAVSLALGASQNAMAQGVGVKSIDPARFYKGTWLEVARRPMWITDGCVVGTTSYSESGRSNEVLVRDACRKGGPSGAETVLEGVGEVLDPGVNSRILVRYNPLLAVEYDIVDVARDYRWFIATSPTLDNLFIYTRVPPSRKQLDALVARARQLGYDTSKLEFPWSAPKN